MLPAEAQGRRRAALIAARALAVAATCVVAGCGGGADGDGEAPPPSATNVSLTLDADGPGGEKPRSATVVCKGSSGAGDSACALLGQLPADPVAPTPPATACTEIFGGPDVLAVEGTLRGERVDTELTRVNGCEIERYERFAAIASEVFPGYTPGQALRP